MEAITIENVRIFDGTGLTPPGSVHLHGDRIVAEAVPGARTADGGGGALLPGLIDTHVHVGRRAELAACARWGVTTALDMAAPDPGATLPLRHLDGVTDLFSAGFPAVAPDSGPIAALGYPGEIAVCGPGSAEAFVARRVRDGVDYLKILVEDPGLPGAKALAPETVAALVRAAHDHGLRVVAHATTLGAYRLAVEAAVDVVTHVPMNAAVTADLAAQVAVASPTLTMMRGVCTTIGSNPALGLAYDNARDSVRALDAAGVTIVAGSDANAESSAPFSPPHGESLHEELRLLVDADLSPAAALRAATSAAAEAFGLADRGVVAAGRRADLVLVDGDPTVEIEATTRIRQVWIGGQKIAVPSTNRKL
ncbi:amidohydrolase family protein [Amycolatopsis endophytica]|uniref:Imidazolonepropionase-like amidohydrolase n=1 Tax=Amycolatopsis endophytica TaxID=860233 RepID=A0A853BC97_9PSEU|nr:amidohydrolase family protein [Amycolatopsis endophytica]NYI92405.1 imidazolonepropionase-like amidohydrolase [Amycolatopsis endophytica]